jgi:hypothetical protein
MSDSLLQVAGMLSKATTLPNRSLKLLFETNEGLSDEQISKLCAMTGRPSWCLLAGESNPITAEDLLNLPKLESLEAKSPSQKLRALLFLTWKKDGSVGDFDQYYRLQMNRYCDWLKEKLD